MSALKQILASMKQMPGGVWTLGLVSMLMDISSEMIHALLPIYIVGVLGASMTTLGLIEGVAEATAMITKMFSGAASDWLGKRKPLAVLGYGLSALAKPVFPLAASVAWIIAARFVDRIGKGIRGAPRDALLADLTSSRLRGAGFGLRQSLDTIGAFVGPLAAMGLMLLWPDNFKLVFWIAVIPAFAALALMLLCVEEPARPGPAPSPDRPPRLSGARALPAAFWIVAAIAFVLTLARFSEAFLVMKARAVGLPVALVPAVMIVMNIVYALIAYPAGAVSDRIGRTGLLGCSLFALLLADLILAFGQSVQVVLLAVAIWGLHMGLSQGLLAALVADTAPEWLRGTAFGVFNLASGVALLLASVVAGGLWDAFGPRTTFLAGAAFNLIALAGLVLAHSRIPIRHV